MRDQTSRAGVCRSLHSLPAAVARYVHVPTNTNNLLNLISPNLGSQAVDEGDHSYLGVGNNNGSEIGTEGGQDEVGNMGGSGESQPEPGVGNNSGVGLMATTETDQRVGNDGVVKEDSVGNGCTDTEDTEAKYDRKEHLKNIRETRRKMTAVRRKLEFQPVDGDIVVEKKREAKTNRGRKLLEAMMVEKNLVQDTSRRMEVVGADVEALYPSLDAV